MENVFVSILRLFMPKDVRDAHDTVRKMRKEDPEFIVTIDAMEKNGKRLKELIRTFEEKYPHYIAKGK